MDQVSADWRTAQTRAALEAFANDAIASGAVAGSPTSLRDLKRTDVGAVATAEILAAAFELSVGDKTVLMQNDNAVIVQLDAINKGDRDSDDTKALRANIEQQFGASLADDLFNVFATQIQQSAGISLNQQAINAVHANFQ